MIFGKSNEEKRRDEETWSRRFAVLPVTLFDGRILWWQTYFVRVSKADPYGGPGAFLHHVVQRFAQPPEPCQDWRDRPPPKPR